MTATNSFPERACDGCGRTIRSENRLCPTCRAVERQCTECGKTFTSCHKRCKTCQGRAERTCPGCGRAYHGTNRLCHACRSTERTCASCGRVFTGTRATCSKCRYGTDLTRSRAQAIKDNHTRRARQIGAQAGAPVATYVYDAIRAEGPCVYCGAPATEVDHVLPLRRGGLEHPDNLVPACGPCNWSKKDRLLIDWHPERVAHGVDASPKVAREYAAQLVGEPRELLPAFAPLPQLDTAAVRAWARLQGLPVGRNGPLLDSVKSAYLLAHPDPVT